MLVIKACRDELNTVHVCYTLRGSEGLCYRALSLPKRLRLWDGEKNRKMRFAVIETITQRREHKPSHLTFIRTRIWERVIGNTTDPFATRYRTLWAVLFDGAACGTQQQAFGRSRLKFPIREAYQWLCQDPSATSIGLEFSTGSAVSAWRN